MTRPLFRLGGRHGRRRRVRGGGRRSDGLRRNDGLRRCDRQRWTARRLDLGGDDVRRRRARRRNRWRGGGAGGLHPPGLNQRIGGHDSEDQHRGGANSPQEGRTRRFVSRGRRQRYGNRLGAVHQRSGQRRLFGKLGQHVFCVAWDQAKVRAPSPFGRRNRVGFASFKNKAVEVVLVLLHRDANATKRRLRHPVGNPYRRDGACPLRLPWTGNEMVGEVDAAKVVPADARAARPRCGHPNANAGLPPSFVVPKVEGFIHFVFGRRGFRRSVVIIFASREQLFVFVDCAALEVNRVREDPLFREVIGACKSKPEGRRMGEDIELFTLVLAGLQVVVGGARQSLGDIAAHCVGRPSAGVVEGRCTCCREARACYKPHRHAIRRWCGHRREVVGGADGTQEVLGIFAAFIEGFEWQSIVVGFERETIVIDVETIIVGL